MKTVEFPVETESNNVFEACGLPEHAQGIIDDKHSAVLARITKQHIFTANYGISDSIKDIIAYSRQITGVPIDDPFTEHEVLSVLFGWLTASAVESTKNDIDNAMSKLSASIPPELLSFLGVKQK